MHSAKQFPITILSLLLAALALLCPSPLRAENASDSKFSVDTSSARLYLDMAGRADKGAMPADAEWDSLFSSAAYKALLDNIHWDKDEFRHNVRRAFEIAYDPSLKNTRDSIADLLADLSSIDDELPFFVSTALSIREKLDEYSTMLANTDMDSLATAANSMTLELVPGRGEGLEPQASPIYFIVWDLECRSLGSGLYLDVNTFFHKGLQAATEALAHEMHHFYLGPVLESIYAEDVMDGAVSALVQNMREGVADIFNKKQMPQTDLYPYGESILKVYNEDYFNSPKVLEELDSITCRYLDNEIPFKEYFREARGCALFEGHTTGDFMVFLIRDRLGMDAVVESVGDLDKFVDNYNKAAEKAGTYRFSDRFTEHIHKVSQPAKHKKSDKI